MFILLEQKANLNHIKKLCEKKDFCNVAVPSEDTKILEFNQCQKSDKAAFIIYTALECLIEKTDGCKNDPENSSTAEVGKHFPSGFSMSPKPLFKTIENKHDVSRGKDIMKKFFESLREHEMEIISFKKKKKKVINKRAAEIIQKRKNLLYLPRKTCKDKRTKDKKYRKVRDHCHYTGEYRGAAHSISNLKYSVPKEISIAFYNGTNHDYHFIMKELAEEFEKEITCLGENTVKPLTFSVPIQKEVTRIDKNGEEIRKIISYRLQFTHSIRFMARSLSNLCNNLAEGIRKIKCKYEHNSKKCEI